MGKYCLLIASYPFACQLITAGTLPSLITLSLTVDNPAGCIQTFHAEGADFSVSGQAGHVCPGGQVNVGLPFSVEMGFGAGIDLSSNFGTVTLNGVTYFVYPGGGGLVIPDSPSRPIVPLGDSVTLTIPATATGTLVAYCSPRFFPTNPCGAAFNPLANLTIDLPGVITVELSALRRDPIPTLNFDRIEDIRFVSTPTPEPSSFALLILGALALAAMWFFQADTIRKSRTAGRPGPR